MKKRVNILSLLIFLCLGIHGQSKVKVITKTNTISYTFNSEFLLDIEAEKANITIETHDKNSVDIVLNQVVKNINQEVAQQDLKAQHFNEKKEKDRLFLKNYIRFENANHHSGSIFKNEYTIKVPEYCHIRIKHTLGNILLSSIKTSINLNVTYGKVELKDCYSKFDAHIDLGEILINEGTITGNLISNNTRIKLQSPQGTIKGKLAFGSLTVLLSGAPLMLDMNTKYCEATIVNKAENNYSFHLETIGGKINGLGYTIEKEDNVNTLIYCPKSDGVLPEIKIMSEENDINIY